MLGFTRTLRTASAILCLSLATHGATYKGINIDGKKYAASVDNGSIILACDVVFDGKAVYVYADEYFTGKLLSEEIVDPEDIEFTVGTESWTLEILDELP